MCQPRGCSATTRTPTATSSRPCGGEPYYGRLHLNADGSFRYRPDPLNPGYDNFDYWAYDGNSLATIGHVYLTLTRPPVARDDDYAALTGVRRREADPGLLVNDFAQEGHAELRRGARHGTATVRPDGAFDYTSDPGFVGTDDFRYAVVVDGERQSVATATIRVKASDRKPAGGRRHADHAGGCRAGSGRAWGSTTTPTPTAIR